MKTTPHENIFEQHPMGIMWFMIQKLSLGYE